MTSIGRADARPKVLDIAQIVIPLPRNVNGYVDRNYCRQLSGRGCNLFADPESGDAADDHPITAMTAAEAIHLLDMHKHKVHGAGKAPGQTRPPRRMFEVQDELIRRAEAIRRARTIPPEQRAADEAATAARRWRGNDITGR